MPKPSVSNQDLRKYTCGVKTPRSSGGTAVGAIRLSSLTDSTSSPERQREIIEHEAALAQVDRLIFTEELDISATEVSVWDRPDLKYWLEHPDKLDHLIVWKMDRVCRNVLETAWLIKWAMDNAVNIICNSPRLDLSSPLGRGIALFIGSIAEMESENTKERIRDARAYMAKVARWPAGKPFRGYRLALHPSGKGHMLELEPVQHAANLRAIELFLSRKPFYSYPQIAEVLEAEGYPPPGWSAKAQRKWKAGNTGWHKSAITKLVQAEALRNVVKVNDVIQRDEDGAPLRYGPPQVDDATWFRIQAEVTRRGETMAGRRPQDPDRVTRLRAVARCGRCTGNLHYAGSSTDKSVRRYACNARGCLGVSIRADWLEEWTIREFLDRVGHLEYTYIEETPGEDHTAEIRDAEEAMAELEADRYERGLFKGDRGAAKFAELYGRLEKRHAELSALPNTPAGRKVIHTGLSYATWWAAADETDQRQAMWDAGVAVYVAAGKRGSTDYEPRLSFEMTGDPALLAEGHDDPNAAENWAA